ncbi:hypothetical protein [Pseudomonas citronellolis]|uniref:hypothetical protein n=1 Tax=Pseudomonas citronellolis TaxID=53408 RepID=UPI00248DEEF0|nr:hypothetical protein [Pseudomonas citronellolis]
MTAKAPRSVRNNNPGNIDHVPANKWLGILPQEQRNADQLAEPRFEVFESPVYGFRALALLLQTYHDRYGADTIRKIINRWAPSSENNTDAYVRAVAKAVGVRADDPIDTHQYVYARPLVEAIANHETGVDPRTGKAYRWDPAQIDEGLRRAGVIQPAAQVAKIPVTKETVGATSVGALGLAQLGDVMPKVADAMSQQDANISSGSWIRIAFGLATIAVAVFIAWSQVRKHQAGLE